ncbi:hypothetical protein KGY73_04450 [bacterium]|nr:hypothetical protein [bacterium]
MKKYLCAFVLILSFTCFSYAQFGYDFSYKDMKIKPGIGLEYFTRTISWDDQTHSSTLRSYFLTLNTKIEFQWGFSITPVLGYSLSNFDGLVFRKLPISLELDVGDIKGLIFGGEVKQNFITIEEIQFGARGEFLYSYGLKEDWTIPGLIVEGTVEGRPSWKRILVGPILKYRGFDYFSPYVFVGYDQLWGTFSMKETIQDLEGSEDKKIKGKGFVSASVGAVYELTDKFHIQAESRLTPYEQGADFGILLKLNYTF